MPSAPSNLAVKPTWVVILLSLSGRCPRRSKTILFMFLLKLGQGIKGFHWEKEERRNENGKRERGKRERKKEKESEKGLKENREKLKESLEPVSSRNSSQKHSFDYYRIGPLGRG